MREEQTLQTEIQRLEKALDSLLNLSRTAEELKKENEKQRQTHAASLDVIKKDYDAVLVMAEELLKSVDESEPVEKEVIVEAKNDNVDDDDEEKILIEL
ncbi:hypothetical protein FAI41_02190 [Acetobacteraceae bacterium]|nr:hypothetical protein FAI41_02190 [Acetobacteraceae bacterium]